MSNKGTHLEEFLAQATTVLQQTERNLVELAQIALRQSGQVSDDSENGHDPVEQETDLRLQQIGQLLLNLSERSRVLQIYLQNGFDTAPPNDEHWSQIKVLQSQEEERAKLAHELEDGVGQLLANAVFELASCRHLLSSGQDVTAGLDALQTELDARCNRTERHGD